MTNPLRRLKFLPWRSLFLVSMLVTVIVTALDFLITVGYTYSSAIKQALNLLYAPTLGIIVDFAIVVGIGALAVYLLEKLYKFSINSAILWALVLCLSVCLLVKTLLPLPRVLVINFDEIKLIGILVGIFWKGRPYWR